ncbi:MAG: hypothetical protein IH614_16630 [Desulfuromonadales bacterium]|nr:hypothetical protein [Desulfuromonadales bacterium]
MSGFLRIMLPVSGALLLLLWGLSLVLPGIARENGVLESLQAILLAVALLALLARSPQWRRGERRWPGFFIGVALLSILLRELEVDRFDLPGWLIYMGDGDGRDLLLGLLWLAVLVAAARNWRHLGSWARQGLHSHWGWTLLLGGCLYLLGSFFDQKIFPLDKPSQLFWEEAMETVGALYIGVGVFRWLAAERRLAGEPSDPRTEE